MKHESKRPVTLEDLLRLKRAERPRPEFWAGFDRELRTKQLAALVDKQPWWSRISHALAGLARYRLPLGATAVLAITFLSVREYRAGSDRQNAEVALPAVAPAGSVASAESLNLEVNPPPVAEAGVLPVYDVRDAGGALAVEEPEGPPTSNVAGLSHLVSLRGGMTDPRTTEVIAANLAATKAAESVIARSLLGTTRGFENRAMSARAQTVEPLSQMTHPSDARSARLLSAVAMMNSSGLPTRAGGPKVSRQISGERLYDQPHRLEGSVKGLSIKF